MGSLCWFWFSVSLLFIDYNDQMRMEGQCNPFHAKMKPCRFYTELVCIHPSHEGVPFRGVLCNKNLMMSIFV